MNLADFPLTLEKMRRLRAALTTVISRRERRMLVEAQSLTRAGAIAYALWRLED